MQKKLFPDVLGRHLAAGLLLELAAFLLPVFLYGLRFPKLLTAQPAILQLCYLLLLLPFLNAFFGIAARSYRKPAGVRIALKLTRPLLLLGCVLCLLLTAFPAYCSSTGNVQQYLHFDRMNAAMAENLQALFPAEIPAEAMEPRYQYYRYSSLLEESVQLSLGETLPEPAFSETITTLRENPLLSNADWQDSAETLLLNATLQNGLHVRVTADKLTRRLILSCEYRILKR